MTTDDRFGHDGDVAMPANDDLSGDGRSSHSVQDSSAINSAIHSGVRAFVEHDGSDGTGRLMLALSHEQSANRLSGDDPRLIRNVAASTGRAANDNVIWVGDDGEHGGIYARDASAITLTNGDIAVAWIGADQIVHARVYSAASEDHFEFPSDQPLTLKATLADLGTASALSHSLHSRLKLSALPDSGFVAAWTTELALVTILFSKVFLLVEPAAADDLSPGTASYASHELPPLPVPRGRHTFGLRTVETNKLDVSFPGHDGHAQAVFIQIDSAVSQSSVQAATWEPSKDQANDPANLVQAHDSGTTVVENARLAHSSRQSRNDDSDNAREPDTNESQTNSNASTSNVSTGEKSEPDDSSAAIQIQTPSAADLALDAAIIRAKQTLASAGTNVPVTLGPADASGHAQILVDGQPLPDTALIFDPDHPDRDLSPSATDVGNSVGVAYVKGDTSSNGVHTTSLVTVIVSETGHLIGGESMIVVTAEGSQPAFSQIDIASAPHLAASSAHAAEAGAPDQTGDGVPSATVAVAWVQNAKSDGYGTVSVQLFRVENPAHDGSFAGSIDAVDSNGAAAGTQADLNGDTPGDVIGRAPDAQGLSDGSLAVAWVQRSDDGCTEDVRAVVINPDSNGPPQALDLSDSMPNGILAGTSPELTTAPDGELIVSWLQAALSGGSEAAAKVFRQVADLWLANGPVIILAHFDDVPQAFSVAASAITLCHDDCVSISLAVAWHDSSGNLHGTTVELSPSTLTATSGEANGGNSGAGSSTGNNGNSGSSSANASGPGGHDSLLDYVLSHAADGLSAAVQALDTSSVSGAASDDDSGSGSQHGPDTAAVQATAAAAADLISDTMSFGSTEIAVIASGTVVSEITAGALTAQHDDSGPSQSDVNSTIAALAPTLSDLVTPSTSGHGANSGSGDASPPAAIAHNDNIEFTSGFGNDVPDYVPVDEHNDTNGHHDAIAALFDDLQLANAFSQWANDEVLTFDANNVVTITNFNSHHGKGGGDYFDTA